MPCKQFDQNDITCCFYKQEQMPNVIGSFIWFKTLNNGIIL